ncbi:MAG: hypothetical protein QOD70_394, partial [Frankiales bacterium]|nr:hypothetical protein [Frankiales bacterium]
ISHELRLEPDDVRAGIWASAILGMVQAAGDRWLELRDCSRETLTSQLTDLLWGAYGSASGAAAK